MPPKEEEPQSKEEAQPVLKQVRQGWSVRQICFWYSTYDIFHSCIRYTALFETFLKLQLLLLPASLMGNEQRRKPSFGHLDDILNPPMLKGSCISKSCVEELQSRATLDMVQGFVPFLKEHVMDPLRRLIGYPIHPQLLLKSCKALIEHALDGSNRVCFTTLMQHG